MYVNIILMLNYIVVFVIFIFVKRFKSVSWNVLFVFVFEMSRLGRN